jgi:hypothetical protein
LTGILRVLGVCNTASMSSKSCGCESIEGGRDSHDSSFAGAICAGRDYQSVRCEAGNIQIALSRQFGGYKMLL